MKAQIIFLFAIALVSLGLSACGGPTTPTNSNNGNTSVPNGNTNNPLAVTTPTPGAVTNNAPTLTPVFKAYCDAWVKNDEAALRKIYSADTLKGFEADMKTEKAKSLIKLLENTDRVSGNPCEVTNEKITGDTAVGTIHSDRYPNGITIIFVKENDEWKMTTRSPALDSVKQSTTNTNTAK